MVMNKPEYSGLDLNPNVIAPGHLFQMFCFTKLVMIDTGHSVKPNHNKIVSFSGSSYS